MRRINPAKLGFRNLKNYRRKSSRWKKYRRVARSYGRLESYFSARRFEPSGLRKLRANLTAVCIARSGKRWILESGKLLSPLVLMLMRKTAKNSTGRERKLEWERNIGKASGLKALSKLEGRPGMTKRDWKWRI
ncbi:small nucleolar ribonucleoprotein complex subunit Utp14 [Histoplasma capsulatum var. duboisii H88]|uniref:Small nucleolar ribonucleoprotein complex subunit Utp14 n=1 Tax=Ajellomyces capsulatus (strain H88) TaxID=544711 RepID=A0A8A1LWA1_AJEC8|nr:small nucleolar ribonucleoprotein complex subunit Utp14 [Histoplasma capsulatum var. duboisii H88]